MTTNYIQIIILYLKKKTQFFILTFPLSLTLVLTLNQSFHIILLFIFLLSSLIISINISNFSFVFLLQYFDFWNSFDEYQLLNCVCLCRISIKLLSYEGYTCFYSAYRFVEFELFISNYEWEFEYWFEIYVYNSWYVNIA